MTLAEPELEDGEDELLEPELELLGLDLELLAEPPDVCDDDDPEVAWPDELAAVAACVVPGKVTARPPATARPRTPAPAVTARSRVRARSRFTTADTVRGSLLFIHDSFTEANTFKIPQRPEAGLS